MGKYSKTTLAGAMSHDTRDIYESEPFNSKTEIGNYRKWKLSEMGVSFSTTRRFFVPISRKNKIFQIGQKICLGYPLGYSKCPKLFANSKNSENGEFFTKSAQWTLRHTL